MNRCLACTTIIFLLFTAHVVKAKEEIPTALKSVLMENLTATENEDIDRMMETIHTQSPSYLQTRQKMEAIFENFDLSYNLLSFAYFGFDGKYAVARVKQVTKKKSGPAFRDNEINVLHVFRKENGKWKFWTQAILEIKYID
jgi:hypothetical protein